MAGQTRYPLIAWLVEFQTAHSASERKSFKDAGLENVSDSSLQSNISRIKDEILLFLNVARVGRREHAVRHQRLGWDAPHVRRAVGREVHDHEDVESITNVAVCVWPVEFVTNFFFCFEYARVPQDVPARDSSRCQLVLLGSTTTAWIMSTVRPDVPKQILS